MKRLVTMFLLVSAVGSAQDEDLSKVTIKVHRLSPSLAMLEGSGGNIGVSFGDDGVYLIDDQFAPLHDKVKAALATLTKKPVRFIINTHWHPDHTGGNLPFGQEGTTIVAHDNVWKRLSEMKKHPTPHAALPQITFDHEVTFRLNGDDARVLHVEHAHTDGDSIVFFGKANVVHMGDTFFSNTYPYIDEDTGGGIEGMIAAANLVLGIVDDKTQIVPGHGPVANKARLKEWRDMLTSVRDNVQKLKRAGKTLKETIAAKPTASTDGVWGHDMVKPEEIVESVYDTVSK